MIHCKNIWITVMAKQRCLTQETILHSSLCVSKPIGEQKQIETASLDVSRLIADLDKDGKLKTSRRLLDRKYIPYPNDKTDYETKEQEQHKEET